MDAVGAIGPAWDRTRRVLFQPFQLATWFSFGLIFFVQSLVEGNASFSYRSFHSGSSSGGMPSLKAMLDNVRSWIDGHAPLVWTVVVTGVVVGLALAVVFLWLGTRGQMMAIRAVMTGRAALGEHWTATGAAGFGLFKVHLVLAAASSVLTVPLLVLGCIRFIELVDAGTTDIGTFLFGLAPFAIAVVAILFVFGVVYALLRNFVAPVMLREGLSAGQAWSRFRGAASAGGVIVFLLLRGFFAVVAGIAATVLTLCTCCVGALPVLHQTILAPWLFFERAYGLCAIESAGIKMLDDLPLAAPLYPPQPPFGGGYPPGGGYAPPGPPLPQTPWNPQ